MSRLVRWIAACCFAALTLPLVVLPGGGAEGAAVPPGSHPVLPREAPSSSGSISSQMAALWDQFRAAQLAATTLTAEIAAGKARQARLQAEIAAYNRQLAQAQSREAADAAQLATTDQQLASLQAGIVTTTALAGSARSAVVQRTIDIYKAGPGTYLGMLLDASSFRDFLSRLSYVGGVVSADQQKLNTLNSVNTQLISQKDQASQRRAQVAAAKAAVDGDEANIAQLRQGVAQDNQELAATVASQQDQLKGIEAQKATYVKDIATLAAEASSITTLVRNRQGNPKFAWNGKLVLWPVQGPISSPYGPRINPIFHTPEFHTGIDIAANEGVPILAAEAGKVIFSGVMQGYGNVVILDHGGSLATLYAHQSALLVSLGDKVTKGRQIGAVGCTGLCTGPHLHFETRVDGSPVQPLTFLP